MNLFRHTLSTWALICLAGLSACANPNPRTPVTSATGCADSDINADQLVGSWRVSLAGYEGSLALVLQPHPEHAGSLRGALMQNPQHHAVEADIDDGEFTMEESRDGQRIAATWLGQVQPGTCGQVITGSRQEGTGEPQRFEMRSDRLR